MNRRSLALFSLLLLIALATTSSAQNCGFPWTVTAAPGGGQTVAVSVCGTGVGCYPHDPQASVVGSTIRVTFQTSEPPDACQCLTVQWNYAATVQVRPVQPGNYTVTTTLLSCDVPLEVGRTTFTLDSTSSIPTLDWRGVSALVMLVAAAAVWRLRTG